MSENWRISKNRSNLECSPWNGAICIEISDDSVHVPSIVAWTTRGSEDKARLIAAAPELLKAAQIVLAGLNARIDQASNARMPVPVFNGIADLHDAINKATGEHNDAGTDTA